MNEWAKTNGRPDDREVIDLMLAHIPTNKVEGAYNRAAYMDRRRELAKTWAKMVTTDLVEPAALLPLPCKESPFKRSKRVPACSRPQLRLVKYSMQVGAGRRQSQGCCLVYPARI